MNEEVINKRESSSSLIGLVKGLIKLIRPRQWVKNLFVLAPVVFSKNLMNLNLFSKAVAAFVLFSLASGVVYIFNDLKDVDADRNHPVKKNRPVASGEISVFVGKIYLGVMTIGVLTGGWFIGVAFLLYICGYLVLNFFYTVYLKRVPYLDVACISCGFLLRVLSGAAVVEVKPSIWLMICTGLLAAYLGLGKRAFELRLLGGKAAGHRSVLSKYKRKHLQIALHLLGFMTVGAYFLYTRAPHTVRFFGTQDLVWTTIFPAIGMFRFWQLLERGDSMAGPTEEMLKDPVFLINMVGWIASVLCVIYFF